MYHIVAPIAERAYATAVKRGKDVSAVGCMQAASVELAEFWAAIDADRKVMDAPATVAEAEKIEDPCAFVEYYDAHIHNTAPDEMADLIITAATWFWHTKEAEGEAFQPERSADVMLACGPVQFVCSILHSPQEVDLLRTVINLKLRYNEVRDN